MGIQNVLASQTIGRVVLGLFIGIEMGGMRARGWLTQFFPLPFLSLAGQG